MMVSCGTCNKHLLRRQKKQVAMMAFCCCCQLLLLQRPDASCYTVLPPLLPLLDQRQ